jgi:hypothetical protein
LNQGGDGGGHAGGGVPEYDLLILAVLQTLKR